MEEAISDLKNFSKPVTLIGENGKTYTTSHLGKSNVFGGGAGAGGGTHKTKIVESAQCVWIHAMRELGYVPPIETFTFDLIEHSFHHVCISASLQEITSLSEDWIYSSYHSSKALIENSSINDDHTLHHLSEHVNTYYSLKDAVLKKEGRSWLSHDKWNPGDIFAFHRDFELSSLQCSSLNELNDSLRNEFDDGNVVPISLKKVSRQCQVTHHNTKNCPTQEDHRIVSLLLESTRGSFWSTKEGNVVFDDGVLFVRPNYFMGSNRVELKSPNSRGGSAGWGYIVDTIKVVMDEDLPSHATIKKRAYKIHHGDEDSIKEFYDLTLDFYPNVTLQQFGGKLAVKNEAWICAKLGAVILLSTFHNHTRDISNRALTRLVNYAGSKGEDSSPYIKVSNAK